MNTDNRNEEMNSTAIVPEVATNTEYFLKRIFHSADPELYSYLVQFDNVNKKIGHCQYFQIKDLSDMIKAVPALNIKPFGLSYSMGLLQNVVIGNKNGREIQKKASSNDIFLIPCLWCDYVKSVIVDSS